MKAHKRLYFIAILPRSSQQELVTDIKKEIADKYHSKAALKSPPHITLQPPFQLEEARENEFLEKVKDFAREQNAFELHMNGFGSFKPRVIYVKVGQCDALDALHDKLTLYLENNFGISENLRKSRKYHPHMTVGFSDLSKTEFWQAWDNFKNRPISFSFMADHLALLRHNGKTWDVYRKFDFAPEGPAN